MVAVRMVHVLDMSVEKTPALPSETFSGMPP